MEPSPFRTIITALLAAAATGAAIPAYASAFTVTSATSSGITTFTITQSGSVASETVYYRTVSLSALEGQHFTAVSGSLTFAAGDEQNRHRDGAQSRRRHLQVPDRLTAQVPLRTTRH